MGGTFFSCPSRSIPAGSLNNFKKKSKRTLFLFNTSHLFDVKILIASSPLFHNHFTNLCFRFQALISPIKMHEEISESHGREKIVSKGHNETPFFFDEVLG